MSSNLSASYSSFDYIVDAVTTTQAPGATPGQTLAPVYYTVSNPGDPLAYGGVNSITTETVHSIPAFWSGLRYLCETLAGFPKHVVAMNSPTDRTRQYNDPREYLLNDERNPLQTGPVFWETVVHSAVISGNGYAYIDRNPDGSIDAMYNLPFDGVVPFRANGQQFYGLRIPGLDPSAGSAYRPVPASAIFHLPGFTLDGMKGMPLVQLMAQSLSVGKSAEMFGAQYFNQGGAVSLVVEVEGKLLDSQLTQLQTQILQNHTGLNNSHRAMVLEKGTTVKNLTPANEAAQFLATRQFSVLDVSRILRVEPNVVYDYGKANYNNLQTMNLTSIQYSFMPWILKMEAELSRKVFTDTERKDQNLRIRFDVTALTRGDYTQQIDNAAKRLGTGISTLNEERALMNMPGIGPKGDVNNIPTYMAPTGSQLEAPSGAEPKE